MRTGFDYNPLRSTGRDKLLSDFVRDDFDKGAWPEVPEAFSCLHVFTEMPAC